MNDARRKRLLGKGGESMQKATSFRPPHGDNPAHKQELLDALAGELPPFIARADVERHLGGMVSGKTLSNADARGEGPEVAYAVGRKIVYSREALLSWLSRNFSVQRLVAFKQGN